MDQQPTITIAAPDINITNVSTFNMFEFPIMRQKLSVAQEIYRTSVVAIGMCLNCFVLLVVSFSRQLRYPRHVFWAAISLSECLFLVQVAMEMFIILNHDPLACRVYVLMCTVDYSVLLLCLLLAACDRYLSIVRYEWYKSSVTIRGVLLLIAMTSALTFVVVTIPFWTGYQSIYSCTENLTHLHFVLAWDLFLGLVCVVLHFKIFYETKILIRQYMPTYRHPPITVRFVNSTVRPSNFNSGKIFYFLLGGEGCIDFSSSIIYTTRLGSVFPPSNDLLIIMPERTSPESSKSMLTKKISKRTLLILFRIIGLCLSFVLPSLSPW